MADLTPSGSSLAFWMETFCTLSPCFERSKLMREDGEFSATVNQAGQKTQGTSPFAWIENALSISYASTKRN